MKALLIPVHNYAHRLREKYFQRFVYIHINKTGGSSIEKALSLAHEHKTAIEKKGELGENRWDKKFVFSFVRNPWDKVVSHYHFRVMTNQTGLGKNPLDFNTWVGLAYGDKDTRYYDHPKMFMPQLDWLADNNGNMLVEYVGRFERLDEDFRNICTKINVSNCSLPHMKQSKRSGYKEYYNNQSRKTIACWFQKDIEYFKYRF